ncbi:MAG: hypothetical protein SGI86_09365 [Deltaproteobacteria bacterium]|nr:hypothetical protein [Deltaproteobacteria bacterium]
MSTKKRFLGIVVAVIGLAVSLPAFATTTIDPPGAWGSVSMTILVGKFSQWPYARVIYRNESTGSCSGVTIPNGGSPNYKITDDIIVNGAGGVDTIRVNRSGSVTCGCCSYSVDTSGSNGGPLAALLDGHWLDPHGAGGNDNIESSLGYPSYSWGEDGNDQILGTEEEAIIYAGSGDDKLKTTNSLLVGGSDRLLDGEANDDCLEDHIDGGSYSYQVQVTCGSGSDEKTTHGNTSNQSISGCEVTNRATACF